jgi:hypothetical protein
VSETIAVPQPVLQDDVVAPDELPAFCEAPDTEPLAADVSVPPEPQAASARAPTTNMTVWQAVLHRRMKFVIGAFPFEYERQDCKAKAAAAPRQPPERINLSPGAARHELSLRNDRPSVGRLF